MSNLATTSDLDADLLLQLASEFNINLEPEVPTTGGSRIYTNFTSIPSGEGKPGVRVMTSSWLDNGAAANFTWTLPGQKDYMEEFENFSNINFIRGYVLHAEIQSSQTVYDAGTKSFKTKCSVTGYRNAEGELIKGLPGYTPIRGMYDGWNKTANRPDYTTPARVVEDLGLVGAKGMACADCIRCGLSTDEGVDDNGNPKITECAPRGRMFFYVTEIGRTKRVPPKKAGEEPEVKIVTSTIRELIGESGVIVQINLPTSSGLRGNYNKERPEENVTGWNSYLMQLKYANKGKAASLADPRMHYTQISIAVPPASKKSPKNMLNFEDIGSVNVELLKEGRKEWGVLSPQKEIEVLDPAMFQKNMGQVAAHQGAIPVAASVVDGGQELRSAAILEDLDEPF